MPNLAARTEALRSLRSAGIDAIFHYVPLHTSPAGRRYGRPFRSLAVTDDVSDRLVRLPLWVGMTDQQGDLVIDAVLRTVRRAAR
jgi:dTDP-4-amino-4,6-dideoxygalactose transaminase